MNTKKIKCKLIWLIVTTIILINCKVFAQSGFTLMVHGGVSIPAASLRGTYILNDSMESSYGMKRGFNLGAEGKMILNNSNKLKGILSLNYNSFRSSQKITVNSIGPGGTSSYIVTAEPKISIFTPSIGLEYSFSKDQRFLPFAGINITANMIGGTGYADTLTGSGSLIELPFKTEIRLGVQVDLGIDIIISDKIGINSGIKYNIANLTKGTGDSMVNEIRLNDGQHTNKYGLTINSKTISYLQYYAGVSFYFSKMY